MKSRNDGVDLLRIMLALMVIVLHYNSSLGEVQANTIDLSFNWYFVWLTETVSFCAVNVYVIITGYYSYLGGVKNYTSILSKLKWLWLGVVFYSVTEYIVISLIFGKAIEVSTLIKRFIPISTGEWWFLSLYFIIYALSPLINIAVERLDEKNSKILMCIGVVSLCIMPQLLLWKDGLEIENGYSLIWFIFLYLTGALLARCSCIPNTGAVSKIIVSIEKYRWLVWLMCLFILFGSKVVIAIISKQIWGEVRYSGLLYSYNSIFVYFAAIGMFYVFKNLSIKNKWIATGIRYVSSLSLASYLFHCQIDFREQVWPKMKCYNYANAKTLPWVFVVTVLALFSCAIIIEVIRSTITRLIKKR